MTDCQPETTGQIDNPNQTNPRRRSGNPNILRGLCLCLVCLHLTGKRQRHVSGVYRDMLAEEAMVMLFAFLGDVDSGSVIILGFREGGSFCGIGQREYVQRPEADVLWNGRVVVGLF